MRKKFLAVLLVLCMAAVLLPTTALAADALPEPDSSTGTTTISENMTLENIALSNGDTQLDYLVPLLHITNGATVTINGGSIAVENNTAETYAILVDGGATLTLNNVNVTSNAAVIRVGVIGDNSSSGTLTVNGGSITATQGGSHNFTGDGIRAYNSKVTLTGGVTFTCSQEGGTGVCLYGSSEVSVDGATITGRNGLNVYGGNLTVEDVTINASNAGIAVNGKTDNLSEDYVGERNITMNGGTITMTKDNMSAVLVTPRAANDKSGAIKINLAGGTYNNGGIDIYNEDTSENGNDIDISVTGGTFDKKYGLKSNATNYQNIADTGVEPGFKLNENNEVVSQYTINDQTIANTGGLGKVYTVTMSGPDANADWSGKYLVIQTVTDENEDARLSLVMVPVPAPEASASPQIDVSVAGEDTVVSLWLTNGMPDLTGEGDSGALTYDILTELGA